MSNERSGNGYEEEWERVYGKDKDPIRNLLLYPVLEKELASFRYGNIVDAGCGNGGLLARLSYLDFEKAVGIDISTKFIKIASEENTDERVSFHVEDLTKKTSIGDRWANLVLSVFVLNEVENLDASCRELARILRPDGRLLIVLTHPFQMAAELNGLNDPPKFTGEISYFDENEVTYHFSLSNATARYFHHNFEHISSRLDSSGLRIKKIRELSTSDLVFKDYPKYWAKRLSPLYALFDVERA